MSTEARLDELLLHWEELREQGQTPPSAQELCRDCPELADELARRIRSLERMDGLLEANGPPPDPERTPSQAGPGPDAATGPAGAVLPGRYRALRLHARGGLGEVFVAHDAELRRDVALKYLQPASARDPASRRRFLREAEITGRLEHPGVVPVYGLVGPEPRPGYAMRLIDGESLQDALQRFHHSEPPSATAVGERRLRFRQLLQQLVTVCQTVAYAHSRGVVHRDLKPANIMLGKYGETLVVDWGLAKRFAPDAEDGPSTPPPGSAAHPREDQETALGKALGTPAYMSPEQAAGRWDQVGPGSDIYSLGATLYALLTGQPPFAGAAVLAQVQQGDFRPPRRVRPEVPRALEAVCLKAMALRPEQRYATAVDLAADLEHWLADEPVSAHRERRPARLARWGRRHKAWVAGAAVLLVSAVVGLSAALVLLERANRRTEAQRDRAEQNRERAEQNAATVDAINHFLIRDLLKEAEPDKNPVNQNITVAEALARAARKVEGAFPDQPEVEAGVRQTIGQAYRGLGLYAEAEPHLRRAEALVRELRGPDHRDRLILVNDLTLLLWHLGRFPEAEGLARECLEGRRRLLGPEHPDTLTAENNLALVVHYQGRLTQAEELFRQNLGACRRVLGPEHEDTLVAVTNLASVLNDLNRLAEAEVLYRDNLERERRLLGPEHPKTLTDVNNLAFLLQDRGRLGEAEALFRECLEACRRVSGPEHPQTLAAMSNLATVLKAQGRLDESDDLTQQCLEARRRVLGPEHPDTLRALNNLAVVRQAQGRLTEAADLLRESLEGRRRVLGPEHPATVQAINTLAVVLKDLGRLAEAEPLFRESLRLRRKLLPAGHPELISTLVPLGGLLTRTGRAAEAEPLLRESLAIHRQAYPAGDTRTAKAEGWLGACLHAQAKYADAEPLLRHSYEGLTAAKGVPPADVTFAVDHLIQLYEAWEKPAEAARWRARQPAPAQTKP